MAKDCLDAFDASFVQEYTAAIKTCRPGAALRAVNREFRNLVTNWRPAKRQTEVTFRVNAGYARLFHLTKRDEDTFGEPPSDKLDPLGVDSVGVWFAGLSYSFK